ncbi:hypothetical protein WKH56_05850 [Priestia sp. SB1]|uniref:hypothetical protein n=1 Tax=Priestia sp. SB1 TaxID=3132359 RepID=UPI003176FEB1
MESQTKKIARLRYRFFDDLYINIESIDQELYKDWSHKEKPTLKHCVFKEEYEKESRISIELSGAEVYDTPEAAQQEADSWNEE